MKRKLLLIAFFAGILFSCNNKEVQPPEPDPEPPIIVGNSSDFRDTTTIQQGTVTITHSRTSHCFPSNEIFAFSATATGVPSNARFVWTFGDGTTQTGTDVRIMYREPGNYTVILEVRTANNQLLQKLATNIQAWGQQVSPHAAFSVQVFDVNFPANKSFTSRSSVPTGTITNYFWDWGDGTTSTTAVPFAQKNYPPVPEDRVYQVRHIVTANSGCRDTAIVPVSVEAVYNISGDFEATRFDGCTNEYFIFTPTAVGVPAGAVYHWDFGDATGFATGNPIRKSFTYQNDYDVKMWITLRGKEIYRTHRWVRAFGQNIRPKALILRNVISSTATTERWAFYSQSNIPHGFIIGYRWDLGNGIINDDFNTYVEREFIKEVTPRTYPVSLIVTSNTGCRDTATVFVTIPPR